MQMHREVRQLIEELVKFPDAKICKHYVILKIVDLLVEDPDRELVEAIMNSDDEQIIESIWRPWRE